MIFPDGTDADRIEAVVRSLVRRLGPWRGEEADAMQEGRIAALLAVRSYDPARGTLTAYVWAQVRGQLLHVRRAQMRSRAKSDDDYRRAILARPDGGSVEDALIDSLDSQVGAERMAQDVRELMDTLHTRWVHRWPRGFRCLLCQSAGGCCGEARAIRRIWDLRKVIRERLGGTREAEGPSEHAHRENTEN